MEESTGARHSVARPQAGLVRIPIESLTRIALAADVVAPEGASPPLIFRGADGLASVVRCPVNGTVLSEAMAAATGIDAEALSGMAAQRVPLGMTAAEWDEVAASVRGILLRTVGSRLDEGSRTRIALGGSAIACFSSAQTAREKKHFPADEAELERLIRSAPRNRDASPAQLEELVASARARYSAMQLGCGVPVAPWFNALHALNIEEKADLDLQIHSDVIDRVMRERALANPEIVRAMESDRLGRWRTSDVLEAFPELSAMAHSGNGAVGLEFLGPGGPEVLDQRTDWWTVLDQRGTVGAPSHPAVRQQPAAPAVAATSAPEPQNPRHPSRPSLT